MAGSLVKMLIGLIFVVASIWWIISGSSSLIGRSGVRDVVALFNGAIPSFLILIGLLMIWLEMDSMKVQKDLSSENKPTTEQNSMMSNENSEMSVGEAKTPLNQDMPMGEGMPTNDKKKE